MLSYGLTLKSAGSIKNLSSIGVGGGSGGGGAGQPLGLAQSIYDEFLVCKICLDGYKRPKNLECLHTFCEDCIDKHVMAESTYKKYSDYRRRYDVITAVHRTPGLFWRRLEVFTSFALVSLQTLIIVIVSW